MNEKKIERSLEIIPGALSWSILICLLVLFIFKPLHTAVIIIVFLVYWAIRLIYMTCLLMLAHFRIREHNNVNWLSLCKEVKGDMRLEEIIQVILYPTYKESVQVLRYSLEALKKSDFPNDKMIVVMAGEERELNVREKLEPLREEYKSNFFDFLITVHPKGIEGEIPAKGANATFASKQIKQYLETKGIDPANVLISCFDADTCAGTSYFSCLAYHFLSNPKRYRTSYQPLPIYSNNIYRAPALARVIEMGSMFWQMVETMRYGKYITFSSHSMSFKTLIEVDYWPVDRISDDSLIYWKCFLKYEGDYTTYPLEVPVFMDIAVGRNIIDTVVTQYRQKRRWAWGVENFVFLGVEFIKGARIPLPTKIRKLYQLLDNHVNWATWGIIISFITPFMLYRGKIIAKGSLVFFNLSYANSAIFNSLTFILLICVYISWQFLPPRPRYVSRFIYVSFILQWLLMPVISAVLGSFPSLDAQTRLMFGKYLIFNVTPKSRN